MGNYESIYWQLRRDYEWVQKNASPELTAIEEAYRRELITLCESIAHELRKEMKIETQLTNEQLAGLEAKVEKLVKSVERIPLSDMTGNPLLDVRFVDVPATIPKTKQYYCEKCNAEYKDRFPARCAYCPAIFTPF